METAKMILLLCIIMVVVVSKFIHFYLMEVHLIPVSYTHLTDGAPIGMFCPSTPTEELTGANEYFFIKNLQGDILKVVGNNGNTVVSYTYDAWGNIIDETIAAGYENITDRNIFRYRGYVYDKETELYYLQSRYYDSKICRFINADDYVSTGKGFTSNNMYVYCLNNPVNLIDIYGNCPFWNGFKDFFVNQWNSITEIVSDPIGAYIDYMTDPINYIPPVIRLMVSEWSSIIGMYEDVFTGDFESFAYTMGGRAALTTETVVLIGVSKGVSAIGNKVMPKVIESKVFNHNGGYGYKAGNFEFLYREPNVKGGTFISYESSTSKWRVSWDPSHTFHYHTGLGKYGRVHRRFSIFDFRDME